MSFNSVFFYQICFMESCLFTWGGSMVLVLLFDFDRLNALRINFDLTNLQILAFITTYLRVTSLVC